MDVVYSPYPFIFSYINKKGDLLPRSLLALSFLFFFKKKIRILRGKKEKWFVKYHYHVHVLSCHSSHIIDRIEINYIRRLFFFFFLVFFASFLKNKIPFALPVSLT